MSLVYTFMVQFILEGSQNRNLEVRNEANHGQTVLAGLLPCLLNCLSYAAQATFPGMAPPIVGYALLHQLRIKKMPTDMATANVKEETPQLRFPLLRCLSFC